MWRVRLADRAAALFSTLSDPTRLRLLAALAGGECRVMHRVERLGLPQPTVSHHLGLLRHAGLVADTQAGKGVLYRLAGNATTGHSAPASPTPSPAPAVAVAA